MKETHLVKAAVKYLHMRGIPCWRQNVGAVASEYKGKKRFIRFGVPGISDIIGLLPWNGRFLAAEAKVGKNKVSDDQRVFLDEVKASGGLAVVFYDLDELHEAINANDV